MSQRKPCLRIPGQLLPQWLRTGMEVLSGGVSIPANLLGLLLSMHGVSDALCVRMCHIPTRWGRRPHRQRRSSCASCQVHACTLHAQPSVSLHREAQPSLCSQVIRSNDVMYKAGQTEMVILRKLSGADPNGKRHCVRMLRSFEYRQHLCLVFESMVSGPAASRQSMTPGFMGRSMSSCREFLLKTCRKLPTHMRWGPSPQAVAVLSCAVLRSVS